jgi:hypothetical protein
MATGKIRAKRPEEIRNPKAEIRRKSEGRNPKAEIAKLSGIGSALNTEATGASVPRNNRNPESSARNSCETTEYAKYVENRRLSVYSVVRGSLASLDWHEI